MPRCPDSTDNIHVLGFSDRRGTSSGSGAMSSAEPEKEAVESVVAPSSAATGTDESDIVIPVAEAVAESAAAVSGGGTQSPPTVSATPRPDTTSRAQVPATPEPRAKHEHRAVAASASGGVAARATVASAEAKTQRPAARFSPPAAKAPEARKPESRAPETRAPERKVAPPVQRPTPAPRRADANDASPPGRPSLFERMTGTGRARRNGGEGDMHPTTTAPRTTKSAEPKLSGSQQREPEVRPRTDSAPRASTALGNDAPKMAAPAPGPAPAVTKAPGLFQDGPSPSARAPGGTNDPLDIPAFLRRQAN